MPFTAIHLAEFPIVAWQRCDPDLRSRPCVVVDGVPPQEKVVARCGKARSAGVEHGMSRVQAEAGSTAVFRPRQVEEEKTAFALLLESVERFTPRVEAIASPANAYAKAHQPAVVLLLDSDGIGTLFGTLERYARQLHAELRSAGFPAGIGAAPNAEPRC